MDSRARMLPVVTGITLAVLTSSAISAGCDELAAEGHARGFTIHDATTTLRDFCVREEDGRWWFALPQGPRYELVTSTSDPDIVNPGDGAFHPFDAAEVRAALQAVRFPLAGVSADVFILPFPRRIQIGSAAGHELILLSPGVRPLSREHQHAEFVHELGHVVQYGLMPDADARWDTYRRLRDIQDPVRFAHSSPHADRPHEIFAEDFRALFGGAEATYSGTIENHALALPRDVAGLEPFLLGLAKLEVAAEIVAHPNPSRGAIELSLAISDPTPLDVYDALGRRIATLAPRRSWKGIEWSFTGADDAGRPMRPGLLFARPRGTGTLALRILLTR